MESKYRISIFGSARINEGEQEYRDVHEIARRLAEFGFDVVTGGGPGIMRAANAGHQSVASEGRSIGLNIKLPFEQQANIFLDEEKNFARFSRRLDTFMSLSDAIVVAPGGIGTLLELFYTWQLVQVEHICETPIIMFGDIWTGLLDWMRDRVLARGLFDASDMNNIIPLETVDEVVDMIKRIYDDRIKFGEVCINYEKYRLR
jgi:uncharacterized protein (TIGR00730 family)